MKRLLYYIGALFCVAMWGMTFISSKILTQHGLLPSEIMALRYFIAYILIVPFAPKKLFANSKKDELLFILTGITGGSVYFLAENTAVMYTLTTNVSLITCITPLYTALLMPLFYKSSKLTPNLLIGSIIAVAGVICVVFNGHFMLKLSPKGDLLALVAGLCWSFYSIICQNLGKRYTSLFMTRKLFFYGILTILPVLLLEDHDGTMEKLMQPTVIYNFAFLGVIASFLCFFLWNVSVKQIGTVPANNLIYFNPLVTLITAHFVLNEPISVISIAGFIITICGVFTASNGKGRIFKMHRRIR